VGVGPTGDILDIISSWPPEEQQRAHAAIEEIEEQALQDMKVNEGWRGGGVRPGGLGGDDDAQAAAWLIRQQLVGMEEGERGLVVQG